MIHLRQRSISASIPVRSFMTKDQLVTFRKNDYVDDVKEVMARKRFRDFPVVDEEGKFLGLVSRTKTSQCQQETGDSCRS